jgi:glycerol kinase
MKATYGTGCFVLAPCGPKPVRSQNRLLGTVASRLGGATAYALEGSIFMAGATVQWLRDGLNLFRQASETEQIVTQANPVSRVVLVPAFVGLGAPYWDAGARGAILNMTRADGRAEIVKAGLESVSLQTRDLMEAMAADLAAEGLPAPDALRVDGGMVANDWFCQNLADLTGRIIERPAITETTALGAALAAGLAVGQFGSPEEMGRFWQLERRFEPQMDSMARDAKYALWQEAVARVRTAGV